MPNTFPDYPQRRVAAKRLDGVTTQRTSNGKLVAWQLWDSIKLEIPVVLPGLSAADRDIVLAFEAANRTVDFYFTWKQDNLTYTVQFLTPVQVKPLAAGRYDLEFTLGEV